MFSSSYSNFYFSNRGKITQRKKNLGVKKSVKESVKSVKKRKKCVKNVKSVKSVKNKLG